MRPQQSPRHSCVLCIGRSCWQAAHLTVGLPSIEESDAITARGAKLLGWEGGARCSGWSWGYGGSVVAGVPSSWVCWGGSCGGGFTVGAGGSLAAGCCVGGEVVRSRSVICTVTAYIRMVAPLPWWFSVHWGASFTRARLMLCWDLCGWVG